MRSIVHRCLLLVVVLMQQAAATAQFPLSNLPQPPQAKAMFPPSAAEQAAMERLSNEEWRMHRVGKFAEAEKPLRSLINLQRRVLGTEHAETLKSRLTLANLLSKQRKFEQSEKECRAVLKIQERILDAAHFDIEDSRFDLTCALNAQQKHAETEIEYRKMLQLDELYKGPRHRDTLLRCCNLACCLLAQGKLTEALGLARRAEKGDNKNLGPENEYSKRSKRVRMEIESALKKQQSKP